MMGRFRVTVEVDTDRSRYGTDWQADEGQRPKLSTSAVLDYAATFGADPGCQWDHRPYTAIVSVEPVGASHLEDDQGGQS